MPQGRIHSVLLDSRKNIWFTSNAGLSILIPERDKIMTFRHDPGNPHSIPVDRAYSLFEDSEGLIWVGCDGGAVCTFNPVDLTVNAAGNIRFRRVDSRDITQGIPNSRIHSIFQDSFGNIWMADFGIGLEFLSGSFPLTRKLPDFDSVLVGNGGNTVWSIFIDDDGTMLAGGTNSIGIYDGDSIIDVINLPNRVSHEYSRVQSIMCSGADILIGLSDGGLLRLDRGGRMMERIEVASSEVGINALLDLSGVGILIGTSDGLLLYRNGNVERPGFADRILGTLSVTGLTSDAGGDIWVATFGSGVFIFDRNLRSMRHLDSGHLGSGAVKGVLTDSDGSVWVLTKQTLSRVKNSGDTLKVERFRYPTGNSPEIFRAITEDDDGNIWFSTDNGIHVMERKTGKFRTFRAGLDMDYPDFTDMSLATGKNGMLYFGSNEGAYALDPDILKSGVLPGNVSIVECVSLDRSGGDPVRNTFPPSSPLRLSHDNASIRIVYAVPDYGHAGSVEYTVMLEGLDSKWSTPSHENFVNYRNLPPGKYTFKVRARLPYRDWDDTNIASVSIIVSPPWWLTWWAMMIYAICIVTLVGVLFRFYRRRVRLKGMLEMERKKMHDEKELNSERLRFYTNVTHELRTPLTLILGPLEDLVDDGQLPDRYRDRIKVVHASTLRLLNLVNQILEFRKTETQNRCLTVSRRNLGDFVTEIGLRYKELNRNDKVRFEIDVENDGSKVYFDIEIVTTVLNNLIVNAMKYTSSGSITLSLRKVTVHDCSYYEMSVTDTGCGIDADSLKHIFERYYQVNGKHQASGTGIGLALVKSLTEVHGGDLSVESTPGKGSSFRFRILSDCTYPNALHTEPEITDADHGDSDEDIADSRETVLVVEDNADIRDYISKSLGDEYNILEAEDGNEGLESALKNNPDIIISDLMMPVMDGLDMLKALKNDIRTSHIPVVMLTTRDSIADKERGYDCGVDSYLTKPFSAKLLISKIRNILSARRSLTETIRAKALSGFSIPEQERGAPTDSDGTHVPSEATEISISRLDREFLEKFTSLVEKNIQLDNLGMGFIRESLNMSHSTLYRKIKSLTGLSGNEFIRKIKLNYALRMMMEGNNVSEAAYKSGFNDIGYFRSCFKEEFGMSPGQYVKSLRGDKLLS